MLWDVSYCCCAPPCVTMAGEPGTYPALCCQVMMGGGKN
jgi:hypothetical protein